MRCGVPAATGILIAVLAMNSCVKPAPEAGPVPHRSPIPPGENERWVVMDPRKTDFIGAKWSGGYESGDVFQKLGIMPEDALRAHACAPGCVQESALAPSRPYDSCSSACLEAGLPRLWRASWQSAISDSIRLRVKPLGYRYTEELRFFPDSVVFAWDSVITVCAAADTTPDWWRYQPLYFQRNRYSKKIRVVYRKWKLRAGELVLTRGSMRTIVQIPYTEPGQERVETVSVPDRKEGYAMAERKPEGYWVRGMQTKQLILSGKSWAYLIAHLL
jgi:hypothetical protein